MDVTVTFRGIGKFQAFVEEYATINFETAQQDLKRQFLADEKTNTYTLSAQSAKDDQEHTLAFMGVCMTYDTQGTQIGGGKAYLDKGQEQARKDITIVFL